MHGKRALKFRRWSHQNIYRLQKKRGRYLSQKDSWSSNRQQALREWGRLFATTSMRWSHFMCNHQNSIRSLPSLQAKTVTKRNWSKKTRSNLRRSSIAKVIRLSASKIWPYSLASLTYSSWGQRIWGILHLSNLLANSIARMTKNS